MGNGDAGGTSVSKAAARGNQSRVFIDDAGGGFFGSVASLYRAGGGSRGTEEEFFFQAAGTDLEG